MRVFNIPIEIVVHTNEKGITVPIRFKINNDDENPKVINVDRIIHMEKLKDPFVPKLNLMVYQCRSAIDDIVRDYELKFEIENCKWLLYKM